MYTIDPGLFEKRFKELDELVHSYEALQQQLKREKRDLDERLRRYEEEREKFENERLQWKEELERKRVEMMEQNDRLTVLSEQLVGAKVCGGEEEEEGAGFVDTLASSGMVFLSPPPNQVELDARTQELASQRIAFEEERLEKKGEGQVVDSEAEELRLKLKEQVKWQGREKERGRAEEGRKRGKAKSFVMTRSLAISASSNAICSLALSLLAAMS